MFLSGTEKSAFPQSHSFSLIVFALSGKLLLQNHETGIITMIIIVIRIVQSIVLLQISPAISFLFFLSHSNTKNNDHGAIAALVVLALFCIVCPFAVYMSCVSCVTDPRFCNNSHITAHFPISLFLQDSEDDFFQILSKGPCFIFAVRGAPPPEELRMLYLSNNPPNPGGGIPSPGNPDMAPGPRR